MYVHVLSSLLAQKMYCVHYTYTAEYCLASIKISLLSDSGMYVYNKQVDILGPRQRSRDVLSDTCKTGPVRSCGRNNNKLLRNSDAG